jgi:hypothetical protein
VGIRALIAMVFFPILTWIVALIIPGFVETAYKPWDDNFIGYVFMTFVIYIMGVSYGRKLTIFLALRQMKKKGLKNVK